MIPAAETVVVHGRSMHPFIPDGTELRLEPFDPDRVTPGDVVTYIDDLGKTVAHRVIQVERNGNETTVTTRGDAQQREENVPAHAVLARVVSVESDGLCYDMASPCGRLIASAVLSGGSRLRMAKLLWRTARRLVRCTTTFTRT